MIIRSSWEAQPWCLGGGHNLIVLECLMLGGYNKFCKDRFMFCIVVTIEISGGDIFIDITVYYDHSAFVQLGHRKLIVYLFLD